MLEDQKNESWVSKPGHVVDLQLRSLELISSTY